DGDSVRPVGVGRCGATADVGLIDNVVVIEGANVDQLDCDPRLDRSMVPGGAELGGEEGQQWTEPFAPGQQQMLGDFGQICVVSGRRLEQACLDPVQFLPNSGNTDKTLEVFH